MTDEYLETFARESEEAITELNNALLAFEDDPTDEAAMERIFRTAHTLKGNCGAMGFDPASDLAHAIEDLLESIRAERVQVTPELMDAVFDGVDELEGMIGEAVQYGEVRTDPTALIETLRDHAAAPGLTAPTDGEVEAVLDRVDARADSDHGVYHVRLEVAGEPASHGPAIVDALDDAFDLMGTAPDGERIDDGDYDGTFDAVFASVVERSAVEAALEPVDAVENHVVTDVTERLDGAADEGADADGADADSATTDSVGVAEGDVEDVSVEELLADEEVDQFDDLEGLAEQVEDTEGLEDLGDAGSFDDLDVDLDDVGVGAQPSSAEADATAEAADDAGADDGGAHDGADATDGGHGGEVQDATSEFQQLKEEVDPVGFDELQEEIEELEFDEYDSDDEVGFDELLGDEVLEDDGAFGDDSETADAVESEASQSDVDSAVEPDDEDSGSDLEEDSTEALEGDSADERQESSTDELEEAADATPGDGTGEPAEATDAAATDAAATEAGAETADAAEPVDGDAESAESGDEIAAQQGDDGESDAEPAGEPQVDDDGDAIDAESDDGEDEPEDARETADDVDDESAPEQFAAEDVDVEAGSVPAADDGEDGQAVPVDGDADLSDDSFGDVEADDLEVDADQDVERVDGFGEEGSVLDLDGDAPPATDEADDGASQDGVDASGADAPTVDGDDVFGEDGTAEDGDDRFEYADEGGETTGSAAEAADAATESPVDGADSDDDAGSTDDDAEADGVPESDVGAQSDAAESDDGAADSVDEVLESVDGAGTGERSSSELDVSDVGDLDLDSSDLTATGGGLAGAAGTAEGRTRSDPTDRYGEPVVEAVDEERAATIRSLGVAGGDPDEEGTSASGQSIRVQVEQLDEMLNLVEELVTSRARLRRALEEDEPRQVLDDELEDLEDVTSELQETVMDVRLVPLRTAVNKLPRIVRDVAREQDKEVDFEMVGEDVELDRSILEEIGDPLVHLVRNAVDHGVEPPEERTAADKPETGSVELRARRERDRVYVTVEDDGRGIDAEEVRDAAVEEGVRTREEVEALDDDAVYDLLFESGFSTADEVTDVSGRGVGMDVVGETVAELDGTVTVESEPDEGTTVELELPVTLAIAEILFVEVGGEEYGVPVKVVDEVGPVVGLETQDGQEVLVSDGGENERALLRLNEELNTDAHTESGSGMLVHLRDDVRQATLLCDAVRGQQEVVVKPFEGVLEDVRGLSGATVLGDGDVVPILDVETL